MVQRRLDETAESARQSAAAKAAAVSARLQTLFGPQRKVMLVSYSLPVKLQRLPPAADGEVRWAAAWVADDFLARTSNSVASDVPTVWVGAITSDCFGATADAGIAPSPSPPPAAAAAAESAAALVPPLTAGGLPVSEFAATLGVTGAEVAVSVSAPSERPALRLLGGRVQTPKGWSLVSLGLTLTSERDSRVKPAFCAAAITVASAT